MSADMPTGTSKLLKRNIVVVSPFFPIPSVPYAFLKQFQSVYFSDNLKNVAAVTTVKTHISSYVDSLLAAFDS